MIGNISKLDPESRNLAELGRTLDPGLRRGDDLRDFWGSGLSKRFSLTKDDSPVESIPKLVEIQKVAKFI